MFVGVGVGEPSDALTVTVGVIDFVGVLVAVSVGVGVLVEYGVEAGV